jgi:coenzyme Q-binding protein COQ10
VHCNSTDNSIAVTLVRGPFRKLTNRWEFVKQDKGCLVEFEIDFEFSNFLLQALFQANFHMAIDRMMKVFIDEAHKRYA